MPNARRAAIYARFSSKNQRDGTSIAVQLDACRGLAGPDALEYIDREESGTSMDRPQFARMMADAKAGMFDCLIVHKFDRFGRSDYSHGIIADLETLGAEVVSATEGADRLSRGVQLVVAADYSRRLSSRIKDSKLHRFREGRWQGGMVPYGYRVEDKRLVVDPGESAWVRELFERYADGRDGMRALAEWLNGQGIKPRRAPVWRGETLKTLLRNPLYKGVMFFRASDSRRRGQDAGDELESRHDESWRIVSDELWQSAHDRVAERRDGKQRGRTQTTAFTRLARCGECNSYMTRRYYKSGKKYDYTAGCYLACGQRVKAGKRHCDNVVRIDESGLIRDITAASRDVFGHTDDLVADAIEVYRERYGRQHDRRAQISDRLAEARKKLTHCVGLLTNPDIPPSAMARVAGEIDAQESRVTALESELSDARPGDERGLEDDLRRTTGELRESLESANAPDLLNRFIRVWWGELTVARDGSVSPVCETPKRDTRRGIVTAALWSAILEAA